MTFGLAALLEHRRRVEAAALANLDARRRAHLAATQRLECLQLARRRGECGAAAVGRPTAAGDLDVVDRQRRLLDRTCEAQTGGVAECESGVASARDALFAARRARKTIEVLRDKRLAAVRAGEHRAELAEIDEANLLRRRR